MSIDMSIDANMSIDVTMSIDTSIDMNKHVYRYEKTSPGGAESLLF